MSGPRDPQAFDIQMYATITATLAEGNRPRAAVLGEHDLDEESWQALDQFWQDRLSSALDEEIDGVPPLISAYAEAFDRARAALHTSQPILSIERFAEATREIQRRGDPSAALSRVGITLAEFLRANEHWTPRLVKDPELARRFRSRLM
jgi:hypothetical protein